MTEHSLPESHAHILRHRSLPLAAASRSDGSQSHRAGLEPSIAPRPVPHVPAHNEWDEWKSVRDVY